MEKQRERKRNPVLTSRDKNIENSRWMRSSNELSWKEIFQYIFSDFFRYFYFFGILFFNILIVVFQSFYSTQFLNVVSILPYPYLTIWGIYNVYYFLFITILECLLFYYEIKFYLNTLRKKIYGV
jgi:hypothetical protein